jgi:predicted transposase YbfD/YdcC
MLLRRREGDLHTQTDKGHGRVEIRRCEVLDASWLDWPGVSRIVRMERTRRGRRKTSVSVAYYVTSLDRATANAERLAWLIRRHWAVETLFHIRDVSMNEDRCRGRSGGVPLVLAAARTLAVGVARGMPAACGASVASTRRYLAGNPTAAARLVAVNETPTDF